MKKQTVYIFVALLVLALTVVGSTYAFFTATTNSNDNSLDTDSSKLEVIYINGEALNGKLNLGTSKTEGINTTVQIKVSEGSVNAKADLYLQIDTMTTNLQTDGFIWEVVGIKNGTEVYTNSGTFKNYNSTTNNKITIVDDYILTTDNTSFTVYLWLNGNLVGNEIVGAEFSGQIGAETETFTGKLIADEEETATSGLFQNGTLVKSWETLKEEYPAAFSGTSIVSNGGTSYFQGLTGDLIIDDEITSIGDFAFANTSFSSITLPSTLTTIGNQIFEYVDLLNETEIYYEGTISDWTIKFGSYTFNNRDAVDFTVHCSDGDYTQYSCFVGETNITMADGSLKQIKDVNIGDRVLSYNRTLNIYYTTIVDKKWVSKGTVISKITLENGTYIECTPNHPVLSTKGWVSVNPYYVSKIHEYKSNKLNIGDYLVTNKGTYKVISIDTQNTEEINVYNLSVMTNNNNIENNTFIANGVVSHNKPS